MTFLSYPAGPPQDITLFSYLAGPPQAMTCFSFAAGPKTPVPQADKPLTRPGGMRGAIK